MVDRCVNFVLLFTIKFASLPSATVKQMFSQASAILSTEGEGGMCGKGVCVTREGLHGKGACMAGEGGAWHGGACMAGGVHDKGEGVCGRGACMVEGVHGSGGVHGRRDGHCSGRYASYWNAFLFNWKSTRT